MPLLQFPSSQPVSNQMNQRRPLMGQRKRGPFEPSMNPGITPGLGEQYPKPELPSMPSRTSNGNVPQFPTPPMMPKPILPSMPGRTSSGNEPSFGPPQPPNVLPGPMINNMNSVPNNNGALSSLGGPSQDMLSQLIQKLMAGRG